MILPHVDDPPRLRGLYVYDFGEWTAVGYTAEEIAILLEDASCRGGKVYKIHRATPDGRMELRGVSPDRFNRESGLFFHRRELAPARADFEEVRASRKNTTPLPGVPAFGRPRDRQPAAIRDRTGFPGRIRK